MLKGNKTKKKKNEWNGGETAFVEEFETAPFLSVVCRY
jgi:hypothetical protein